MRSIERTIPLSLGVNPNDLVIVNAINSAQKEYTMYYILSFTIIRFYRRRYSAPADGGYMLCIGELRIGDMRCRYNMNRIIRFMAGEPQNLVHAQFCKNMSLPQYAD